MCWFIPNREATSSIYAPSEVVLSLLDFILKSPSTTIKSELDSVRVSRVSSEVSVSDH